MPKKLFCKKKWINIFAEIFGYSLIDDEIEAHRNIQIGSGIRCIPDIIISKNKTDLFVVELKRGTSIAREGSITAKNQLFSYLKLLTQNIGMIIGDKIYLFYYDYSKDDTVQNPIEILFEKDSLLGEKFVELFSKKNYNKDSSIQFILDRTTIEGEKVKIKEELRVELITTLLKDHFKLKYDNAIVDTMVEKFSFSVREKYDSKSITQMPLFAPAPIKDTCNRLRKKMKKQGNITEGNLDYGHLKIGEIAREILVPILEKNEWTEYQIEEFQNADYSKINFGLQYPLLTKVTNNKIKIERYAKPIVYINNEEYWRCSEWYETPSNNDRPLLLKWIYLNRESIKTSN